MLYDENVSAFPLNCYIGEDAHTVYLLLGSLLHVALNMYVKWAILHHGDFEHHAYLKNYKLNIVHIFEVQLKLSKR